MAESSGEEAARAGPAALGKSSDAVSKHARFDWPLGSVGNWRDWETLRLIVVTGTALHVTRELGDTPNTRHLLKIISIVCAIAAFCAI